MSEKSFTFVRDQSHLDDSDLDKPAEDLITLPEFTAGYQFFIDNQAPGKILRQGEKYFVLPKNAPADTSLRQKAQKFIQVKSVRNILNFESAETFKEWRDANSQVITIKYVGGTEVLCSCRLGKKKKWCEHRVVL